MIIGDEAHWRFQAGKPVVLRELAYAMSEAIFGFGDDGFVDDLGDRSIDLGPTVIWGPSDESGSFPGTATDTTGRA